MKTIPALLLVCLMSYVSAAQHMQKRLDSLADFYRETFDFNGTILVTQKGTTLLDKGYGYQDKQKNVLNSKESIYLIGSVTKQFTAEVILMLASQGKLSVQDRLSKYYPDYKYGDSITIEHLLTHTSGIFDYTRDSAWQQDLVSPMTDKTLFSKFWNKPLNFFPGTKYSYSNSGYALLGKIIEKVTGESYYTNVRKKIFEPLGMTHSGFDFAALKDKHKTTGYYYVKGDSFYVSLVVDSTQTNAAGGIYSTTGDMLRWHRALQANKLLSKEWQDKAYVPYRKKYGYGWVIDTVAGQLVLSHSGFIHGYNSNFYRLPEQDVCIVVFTNLMKTGADPEVYVYDVVKAMFDPEYTIPAIRKEIQLPENVKKRYEGVYTFTEDSTMSMEFRVKDNRLVCQMTGQPEILLLPQSETMFFTRVVDAQIEFKKNTSNEHYMVLHQNGQQMEARKRK